MNPHPGTPERGNPPNREQLNEQLGDRMALWNEVRETVVEIGASWKWAHSEATRSWSYRSYLPGDRFFAALTPKGDGFEVSLNLSATEWEALAGAMPHAKARLDALRTETSGEALSWIHVPVESQDDLPLLAQILVVRARRVQKPRLKGKKLR